MYLNNNKIKRRCYFNHNACPYEYGTAVSARELPYLVGDTNTYFNPCEFDMLSAQFLSYTIELNGNKLVKVYPSPAKGKLIIEMVYSYEGQQDMKGSVILEKMIPSETKRLIVDTSNISNGVYLLCINDNAFAIIKEVIVLK